MYFGFVVDEKNLNFPEVNQCATTQKFIFRCESIFILILQCCSVIFSLYSVWNLWQDMVLFDRARSSI